MIDPGDEEEADEGAPAWMATFSDLATLLLTFFVLLLSFAEMDVKEFRQLLGSIRDAFGSQMEDEGKIEARSTTPVELNDKPSTPLVNIAESSAIRAVRRTFQAAGVDEAVDVLLNERGIVVRIRDAILFDPGSDYLYPKAKPVIDKIAGLSKTFKGDISIEGHTDDAPIHTSRFPSNWELAAGRAASVVRYLLSSTKIDRDRLKIAGYADTRPVAPNTNRDNRAKNRRVEFVFGRPTVRRPVASDDLPAAEVAPDDGPIKELSGSGNIDVFQ